MTVTMKNITYTVEPTGLKNVAYTLTVGKKICKGIRNFPNPDLIICIDKGNREIGMFLESTMKEVVRL